MSRVSRLLKEADVSLRTVEDVEYIISWLKELHTTVKHMEKQYEGNPELNDIQPNSMQKILPMSLDEWSSAIAGCIEDWENLNK